MALGKPMDPCNIHINGVPLLEWQRIEEEKTKRHLEVTHEMAVCKGVDAELADMRHINSGKTSVVLKAPPETSKYNNKGRKNRGKKYHTKKTVVSLGYTIYPKTREAIMYLVSAGEIRMPDLVERVSEIEGSGYGGINNIISRLHKMEMLDKRRKGRAFVISATKKLITFLQSIQ